MKNRFLSLFGILLLLGGNFSLSQSLRTDVTILTDSGNIGIHLYSKTKQHRRNFIRLVKQGYYDGTEFHRVIDGFMIQGGDPYSKDPSKADSLGEGGPGYQIPAEIFPDYFHKRGVIAAAREGDDINPQRLSSGCQFYIVDGKKFPEGTLEKSRDRIRKGIGDPNFEFTPVQTRVYAEEGGAPWLDRQYTVFGEVVHGMEVVDRIAAAPRDKKDRPLQPIHMKIIIGKSK